MTALALERDTSDTGAPLPCRGTFPIAANTQIFKGSQVALDSAGRAIPATTLAGGAVLIAGRAHHTVDNRTGSELGGAAGAANVEVDFGCFGWENSAGGDEIAADDVGKPCYAVDDQTVALTSGSSTRAAAGFISEVRDGQVFVHESPAFSKMAATTAAAEGGVALQKRTVTVGHADLTDADTSQTVNIGAALPANARILGVDMHTYTAFAGGAVSALVADIGSAGDADALVDGADLFGAAVDGKPPTITAGVHPSKLYAAATQLTATFVSTGGNLADLTAGAVTIDVLFAVLA